MSVVKSARLFFNDAHDVNKQKTPLLLIGRSVIQVVLIVIVEIVVLITVVT
jgi:hypothetical protein